MVFNLSYGVRVLWDIFPKLVHGDWTLEDFTAYMVANLLGLVFDYIPVFLIIVLHRKNLQAVEDKKEAMTEAQ